MDTESPSCDERRARLEKFKLLLLLWCFTAVGIHLVHYRPLMIRFADHQYNSLIFPLLCAHHRCLNPITPIQ